MRHDIHGIPLSLLLIGAGCGIDRETVGATLTSQGDPGTGAGASSTTMPASGSSGATAPTTSLTSGDSTDGGSAGPTAEPNDTSTSGDSTDGGSAGPTTEANDTSTSGDNSGEGTSSTTTGSSPACGNLVVEVGEECDDGNLVNNDGCSNSCEHPRLAFVSSTAHSGILGGIDGADAECNALAGAAGLPGNFRAWVSTIDHWPKMAFDTNFAGVYRLVDGTVVVSGGWSDLTDGSLEHGIDRSELNTSIAGKTWSGTDKNGICSFIADCDSWTSAIGKGRQGSVGATDFRWTDLELESDCNSALHIYCFEDP